MSRDQGKSHVEFVDVSGMGFSGKGAVLAMLSTVNSVFVPPFELEMDFFRLPGGLLDLRRDIKWPYSPIRADHALKRFSKLAGMVGADPGPLNIVGRILSGGHRLDRFFNGRFTSGASILMNRLTKGTVHCYWPFNEAEKHALRRTMDKLLYKMKLGRLSSDHLLIPHADIVDIAIKEFVTQLFIDSSSASMLTPYSHIILNNAFEPFRSEEGLDLLSGKQIVVMRDPRDIYVDCVLGKSANDIESRWYRRATAPDAEMFIDRYRNYVDAIKLLDPNRVLVVRFEELVAKPIVEGNRIRSYLGVLAEGYEPHDLISILEPSRANVGLWRRFAHIDEIKRIESVLSEFLYLGDK